MELRQIKYFLTIVEEKSMSKAAIKLNMTQPPLSRQIALLEHELDTLLFIRHPKAIKLTEEGKLFYERAKEIAQLVDTTEKEFQQAIAGETGTLSIACIDSLSSKLLPEHIQAFIKNYPNVNIRVWSGDPNEILTLVDQQFVELGIVRLPILDQQNFEVVPLDKDPIVLAMNKSRNLGGERDYILLEELADVPLICIRPLKSTTKYRHQSVSEMIVDFCQQKGIEPRIICESNDIMTMLTMAKYDIGVTAVPKSAINLLESPELVFKEIKDQTIMSRQSALIWKKGTYLSPISKNFIKSFPETLAIKQMQR